MTTWRSLTITLERAYCGPPTGRMGEFEGTILSVWQLIRGSVEIEKEGLRVESTGGDSRWVICTPGRRWQRFSDDAELLSLHLLVESPGNGAEWSGVPLVAVTPDDKDRLVLEGLLKQVRGLELTQEDALHVGRVELPLAEALAVRSAVYAFMCRLMRLLGAGGMRYEPPSIVDERVRASYRELASCDPTRDISMDKLASSLGISQGQLNRLWQKELGTTPKRFWDQRRVRYASNLLQIRKLPVKVVAAELGYRHLSQFSNWFSERVGSSPREYRQRRLP